MYMILTSKGIPKDLEYIFLLLEWQMEDDMKYQTEEPGLAWLLISLYVLYTVPEDTTVVITVTWFRKCLVGFVSGRFLWRSGDGCGDLRGCSCGTQTQEYYWTGRHCSWGTVQDSSGTLPEAGVLAVHLIWRILWLQNSLKVTFLLNLWKALEAFVMICLSLKQLKVCKNLTIYLICNGGVNHFDCICIYLLKTLITLAF